MKYGSSNLILVFDLAGTLVFAVEGSMAAVAARLDVFGVMVLAFATALAGGIIRDLLIGAAPPNSIRDFRYAATAFAGGAIVIVMHQFVQRIPSLSMIEFDAAGLALFTVAGTSKALAYGIHPMNAALMGTLTGERCGISCWRRFQPS